MRPTRARKRTVSVFKVSVFQTHESIRTSQGDPLTRRSNYKNMYIIGTFSALCGVPLTVLYVFSRSVYSLRRCSETNVDRCVLCESFLIIRIRFGGRGSSEKHSLDLRKRRQVIIYRRNIIDWSWSVLSLRRLFWGRRGWIRGGRSGVHY